jgi:hypothetical protein
VAKHGAGAPEPVRSYIASLAAAVRAARPEKIA